MKAELPKPEHFSYEIHRKQIGRQVILPVILAGVVMVAMIVLISIATFRDGGDVGRWAAISTIWLVIPVIIVGLIGLAVLIGLIYVLAKLLGILPTYTGIAQDYVYLAHSYVIKAADMAAQPIIGLNGIIGTVKAFFGRK